MVFKKPLSIPSLTIKPLRAFLIFFKPLFFPPTSKIYTVNLKISQSRRGNLIMYSYLVQKEGFSAISRIRMLFSQIITPIRVVQIDLIQFSIKDDAL